jgi:hypothetical protein
LGERRPVLKKPLYRVLLGKPEGRKTTLEDPSVDGTIMLRRIFRKWDGGMDWIDLGTGGGHL